MEDQYGFSPRLEGEENHTQRMEDEDEGSHMLEAAEDPTKCMEYEDESSLIFAKKLSGPCYVLGRISSKYLSLVK